MENVTKKKIKGTLIAVSYIAMAAAIVVSSTSLFKSFYYDLIYVSGSSMSPTLDGGTSSITSLHDYGVVDKHDSAKRNLKRFQIVTTYYPGDTKESPYKIKRLLVKPGETFKILDNNLYLYNNTTSLWSSAINMPFDRNIPSLPKSYNNGEAVTLKDDQYFLAGDNWANSYDSFNVGPISYSYLVGVVVEIQGKCKVNSEGKVYDKTPTLPRYFLGVDY